MKAMLFTAGLGTRLRPLTNDRPKALVEVNGVTLLEINIRRLVAAGFTDIVVNVHHFADMVIDFLRSEKNWGAEIHISDERQKILETGGGLKKAEHFFKNEKAFLVCNVDILTDMDLKSFFEKHVESNALATLAVRNRQTSRYLLFNENKRLYGWKNIKTGEVRQTSNLESRITNHELAFSGIHVLSPRIFKYMPKDENKFSIIETYLSAMEKEKIIGHLHDDDKWIDVGKPESLAKAEIMFPKF